MKYSLPDDIQQRSLDYKSSASTKLTDFRPDADARQFLLLFAQKPKFAPYHFISTQCLDLLKRLERKGGVRLTQTFLRYTLASAIVELPLRINASNLPSSIVDLYIRHIKRILTEFSTRQDSFYSVSCDKFLKDLCILTLRLYPAGGRLIEPDCGIPRRLVWQGISASTAIALRNLLFKTSGFKPFLQFHTHTSDLADFNPSGMTDTYARVAELLTNDENCLGLYTASWFNDPNLRNISPRLQYLHDVPVRGGAFTIRGEIDNNSTAAALSRSETRRQLYSKGLYRPRIYYIVWPRASLLHWADTYEPG